VDDDPSINQLSYNLIIMGGEDRVLLKNDCILVDAAHGWPRICNLTLLLIS
jgi:hypothetical protein